MLSKLTNPIKILIVFSIISCLSMTVLAQEETDNTSSHIILQIVGAAEYRDTSWGNNAWQPLSVGLPVRSNWLIRPVGPSSVTVLCAGGGESRTIRETTATSGCIDIPSDIDVEELLENSSTRGNNVNPNNVTILSPVERIATTTPRIIWTETRDFETYLVSILDSGLEIFSETVTGNSYTIEDETIFQRGKTYTIRVTPLSALNDPQFNFRGAVDVFILSNDDYTQFSNRSRQVFDLTVREVNNADIAMYTEAWTFYEYALFSEAAATLTQIISPDITEVIGNPLSLSASPYPYILGGDTLRGTGLTTQSLGYYSKALQISKSIGDRWLIVQILNRMSVIEDSAEISECYAEQAQALTDNLLMGTEPVDLESVGVCA